MDKLNCLVKDSFGLKPTGHGMLNGKTFVVKDNIAIAKHVSSFGHPAWRASHRESTTTSPIVAKLLEAGADMVGLAKLDQLTYSLTGNVGEGEAPLNTLYPDRFTGGSSSGSASAVAGKLADIGIGTDTAGSIRTPAAACGLFGIRPTYGRIDTTGVLPLASSFDTVGLITRDAILLRDVFTLIVNRRITSEPIKKILLPTDCFTLTTPEIVEVVKEAAARLSKTFDISVEEITFGSLIEQNIADLFMRLQAREIWEDHGEWVSRHKQELAIDVQIRLTLCEELSKSSESEKERDKMSREEYFEQFSKLMQPGSIMIIPVTPSLSPKRDAMENEITAFRKGSFRLTAPAGLARIPEVVIPLEHHRSGLTYGVGLLGANSQDEALLDAAIRMMS